MRKNLLFWISFIVFCCCTIVILCSLRYRVVRQYNDLMQNISSGAWLYDYDYDFVPPCRIPSWERPPTPNIIWKIFIPSKVIYFTLRGLSDEELSARLQYLYGKYPSLLHLRLEQCQIGKHSEDVLLGMSLKVLDLKKTSYSSNFIKTMHQEHPECLVFIDGNDG